MHHLNLVLLAPLGYVLLACVLRINAMEPGTTGIVWRAIYLALAAWTGWVAADLAGTGSLSVRDAIGVLGMAAYMRMTRERWRGCLPEIVRAVRAEAARKP